MDICKLALSMNNQSEKSPKSGSFEFQKWPVYQNAVAFVGLAYGLCERLPKDSATGIRGQLRRAAQSIPLNIAEGSARYSTKDKTNFLRVAKGSVFECVAILDLLPHLKMDLDLTEHYRLLETIGRMISGLIGWLEKNRKQL
jgi:four helix bundle protein